MIEHAKIFISIISLMIGTWAVVYAFQMYKSYAFSFLKLIAHYTFLFNLGFLILLITKYIEINLSENFMSNVFPYYKDITELVITLVEIGLITLMLRIFLGFQEKDISPRFKGWVGAGVIILVLSYGIKMILPHASSSSRWFDIVQSAIFSNLIILEFPAVHVKEDPVQPVDPGLLAVNRDLPDLYLVRWDPTADRAVVPVLFIPTHTLLPYHREAHLEPGNR